MANTIRQRVIDALQARVGAIRGLEQIDQRDMPLTVLVAGDDTAEQDYDMVRATLPVTIGRAKKVKGIKSDEWYAEGETLVGEIIADVYEGGEELDGIPVQIEYTGSGVEAITDGATGVMAQASFEVRYAWLHGDPTKHTPD